jgi:prepilin-type N-terminal cleavage/methylation domain-containing protein/prepilin-type processing-associated H-X9-DG protein
MAKKSGFSLVELMVVIAILAILAALILAGLASAKNKARQTQCINNLRQLGIGLCQFAADYHVYPLAVTPSYLRASYPEHSTSWHTALETAEFSGTSPFTQKSTLILNKGIWVCPSAHQPDDFPADTWSARYGYNCYGVDAQTNTDLHGLGGQKRSADPALWSNTTPPVRESDVVSPSQMLAIGDGFTGNNGVIRDATWAMDRERNTTNYLGSTARAFGRHDARANTVFCDGHASSPSLKLLFEDTGDAALSLWNSDHQSHRAILGL